MRPLLTLLLGSLLLTQAADAQIRDLDAKKDRKVKSVRSGDPKPFTLKWNPGSLAFGKVSLHTEYNLKRKKSLTLGIGIPVSSTFKRTISGDDIDMTNKTMSAQAGYRMYLGKKTMTGFYFEPYLKYVNFKGFGRYDDKEIVDRDIYETNITYSGGGLGAQLGVQFMIARTIVFDLFLLGPEANIGKIDASFRDVQSPLPWTQVEENDARREIENVLEDIPVIGKKTEVTVNKNQRTVNAKYDGFVPGFRFGLSVGVHF
ncbi:MAG: DUF3575 domain-containing protein [Chitinophagaceae bacterium]|nr:MAG: DUF3575 domain-containing protein [Chitinophagaceae bacterium]